MIVLAYAAQFARTGETAEPLTEPSELETPGFHVLSLNATGRTDTPNTTSYDFPFDSSFYIMFERYSGSVVLLIRNCSGPNYTMTFRAGESLPIDSIAYHGQALIAFGGWTSGGAWGWMENATMYWRQGLWEPTDGITVERGNAVLGLAELSVLYIVPQAIPEFSNIAAMVVAMLIMILWLGGRR